MRELLAQSLAQSEVAERTFGTRVDHRERAHAVDARVDGDESVPKAGALDHRVRAESCGLIVAGDDHPIVAEIHVHALGTQPGETQNAVRAVHHRGSHHGHLKAPDGELTCLQPVDEHGRQVRRARYSVDGEPLIVRGLQTQRRRQRNR